MNEIIELLKLSPGLSITLGFIFAGFTAWLFKDLIVLYVKKKYDLFDLEEIRKAIDKSIHYNKYPTKNAADLGLYKLGSEIIDNLTNERNI